MLEAIYSFIIANPFTVGTAVVLVSTFLASYRATRSFRESLYALMLRAEKAWKNGEFGSVTGEEVMQIVVTVAMNILVPRLPIWMRVLVTPETVKKAAQSLYNIGMDYLDDGKFNKSYLGM